jgi:hypothetical protein
VLAVTGEALHPLLQSSKQGVVPHRYIALAGDSYAAGMGDWATAAMQKPMAHYSSANLLHEEIGKDVISFGSAGAGSIRGIVTEPVSQLGYLRKFIDRDIESPEWILVYFYEGNDLYDNAAYFHYSFPRLFDIKDQFNTEVYQKYLQIVALDRDDTVRMTEANDWLQYWPFTALLNKTIRVVTKLPERVVPKVNSKVAQLDLNPPWILGGASTQIPGRINQAWIDNKTVQLPDRLQGPALALTEDEWQQAWFAFEQSLLFAQKKLPNTHFALVYIPSVLSVYHLQSHQVSVQTYERRQTIFSTQQAIEQSQRMRSHFVEIAQRLGLPYVDTTSVMQKAAQRQTLHGPDDWNHFNKLGYETLSASISHTLGEQLSR